MDRPCVGVGVIVKKDDKILLLKRSGAHGEGTWSLPGGHPGIAITDIQIIGFTNDPMKEYGKHYITLYVESAHASGEARIIEPEKCVQMGWFSLDALPEPLFPPFRNFVENKPYPRRNI